MGLIHLRVSYRLILINISILEMIALSKLFNHVVMFKIVATAIA